MVRIDNAIVRRGEKIESGDLEERERNDIEERENSDVEDTEIGCVEEKESSDLEEKSERREIGTETGRENWEKCWRWDRQKVVLKRRKIVIK